jgi:hypothetical protein
MKYWIKNLAQRRKVAETISMNENVVMFAIINPSIVGYLEIVLFEFVYEVVLRLEHLLDLRGMSFQDSIVKVVGCVEGRSLRPSASARVDGPSYMNPLFGHANCLNI